MADGTVISFPEGGGSSVNWEQFWKQSSQIADQMHTAGSPEEVIIDALDARLTQELTLGPEIDVSALTTGSEHESMFVRAVVAGKIDHACRLSFAQGAALTEILTTDSAHTVRARAIRAAADFIAKVQANPGMAEEHNTILKILSEVTTDLSKEVENHAVTRHPSGGSDPHDAA